MPKEINWVCGECGIKANYLTCLVRYGNKPTKLCYDVSTSTIGKCNFCGEERMISPIRDFFYPEFELLKDFEKIINKISK